VPEALPIAFNPLNAELNPICHLLALLVVHHILHVRRIRVKRAGRKFLALLSISAKVKNAWRCASTVKGAIQAQILHSSLTALLEMCKQTA
jgi:hypothetical protein